MTALALGSVLALGTPVPYPAGAHEVADDVRYELEHVPEVDGVTVQVVRTLAPQVVLASTGGATVEVLDGRGEPFLRVGPDGVAADVDSHAWRDSLDPSGLPADAEVPAGSRWQHVRDEPSWGWFDHRLHETDLLPRGEPGEEELLDRFAIGLRIDGQEDRITGRIVHAAPHGRAVARLTSDRQPLEGVRVQLIPGTAAALMLAVEDDVLVEVLGADGEPFLRFGRGGVEANERSPTWWRAGRARVSDAPGDTPAGPAADGSAAPRSVTGAEPRWVVVSEVARFAWLDPRLASPDDAGAVPLTGWQVPLRTEEGEVSISGELRWVETASAGEAGSDRWQVLLPALVATLGGAVGWWGWRRRRTVA